VLGWGLADDEQAIAYMTADDSPRPQFLCSPSAARFPRLLRRGGDVRLIWIDAGPTEPAEPEDRVSR
jgi:hypothetical protein